MKGLVLVVSLGFCIFFLQKTFGIWQGTEFLKNKNSKDFNEISRLKVEIQRVSFLADSPAGLLEDNYRWIERQIRFFDNTYDLKMIFEFMKIAKNNFLLDYKEPSQWLGVNQIPLHLKFFDLKGLDQRMLIFSFLRNLELTNPVEILEVVQTGNNLEVNIQIFGRGK